MTSKPITITPIVIIGSSGHAKVVIDIAEREGKYAVVGLVDRFRKVGEQTLGYRVLGREEDLPQLVKSLGVTGAFVAIGDNFVRSKVAAHVAEVCPDLPFVSLIHPKASIAKDVSIGHGTVIVAGVTVNASCSVGRFCILNTNSSLDHDSVMEDFSSLAPNAATGGKCRIGSYAAVSIGAVVINGVRIGEHTIIGAGSTVIDHIEACRIAYGTPARSIKARKPGDPYL